MKEREKIEKEIREVEDEINNYIHSISDIKVPTDKEFNRKKKIVTAKVISSEYYLGVTASTDIVYDVIFRYVVNDIIYESRMQTLNNYRVGDNIDIYYYKKNPNYIKEIDDDYNNTDYVVTKLLTFSILLIIASILFIIFCY